MSKCQPVGMLLAVLALTACSAGSPSIAQHELPATTSRHAAGPKTLTPIQHVIIVIQENRSFDQLFNGFPGANTSRLAHLHDGTNRLLKPVPLGQYGDISHLHTAYLIEYDGGKMDGFDLVKRNKNPKTHTAPDPLTYTQQSDVQPYWDIAQKSALADDFFASVTGPSYPAHLYLIAGGAQNIIGLPNGRPWGCAAPPGTRTPILRPDGKQVEGPFPCFDWTTLADELDAAHISWRFYAPYPAKTSGLSLSDWSTYLSIRHIYEGQDWTTDVINPETQILDDIKHGALPSVSWVTPKNENSDHADNGRDYGPSWIASIVNAVAAKSDYATNTVVFITWDEWGGWYDHVRPPVVDEFGLGFRVPLIISSGYTKPGYVSHVQHEFGSVLRFTEENWGLGQLGPSDTRADDLMDIFDFNQNPHPMGQIKAPYGASFFLDQQPDPNPVDDDE